jgi:selenocysteine lyase/cysteine desulfurase
MIPCQRHLFAIPEDVAYFNCAYTSPLMRTAVRAGEGALQQKQAPWTVRPTDFFETAEVNRTLFGRLVDGHPDQVAIIPAVSYGIALATRNIPIAAGQTIVVLQDQFPSNVYAWRRVAVRCGATIRTVPRPSDNHWTPAVLAAIDASTAVAALPHCHWTDGSLLDLAAIGAHCRAAGAALVVDAIQSLGALPFSVQEIQPDFLVTAAHKWLLGPYAYGFCYVAERWLDGTPLEENWLNREHSEDFARLVDYRDTYQPGARRFDMGAYSSFLLAPLARAALEQILEWGVENIAASVGSITGRIADRAAGLGFRVAPESARAPHLLGLYLPGGLPAELPVILARDKVYVSVRGNAIRVAPHLYNTEADLARLLGALEKIAGAKQSVASIA